MKQPVPAGFISLRTAASRLSKKTRQKGFHKLEDAEAQKLLRELSGLLVAGDAKLLVRHAGGEWKDLGAADRLKGLSISYVGETPQLEARTGLRKGTSDFVIREADFRQTIGNALGRAIPFEELWKFGVPKQERRSLRRWQEDSGFPPHFLLVGKACWWSNQVLEWVSKNAAMCKQGIAPQKPASTAAKARRATK